MSEIAETVIQIISDKLVIDPSEITYDANLTRDLGADSVDLVELTMELERAFEISIPEEHAEQMQTVIDIIQYLQNQL